MEIYGHIKNYEEDELLSYVRYFPYKYMTISQKNKTQVLESLLGLKLLQDLLRNTDSLVTLRDLRFNANGKPYFPGESLFCSFAHSDGMAVCCLEKTPVGIDLEKIKERDKGIPLKLLHPDLLAFVGQKDWIRAWVHQEAVFKCFGWRTLTDVLKTHWLSPYLGTVGEGDAPETTSFSIRPIEDLRGYYIAVCSTSPFSSSSENGTK